MVIDNGTQVGWEAEPWGAILLRPFDRIEVVRSDGSKVISVILPCNFKAYGVVAIGQRDPAELSWGGVTP